MANKLADALAFQQQRRQALSTADAALADLFGNRVPQPEQPLSTGDYLENLSTGLGRGFESQLEGAYQLARHPIESGKAMYQAGKQVVQNPAMLAEALKSVGQQATSGPLGLGQVAGEYLNPRSLMPRPMMKELDVYHGTPHRFPATEANPLGEFDASKIGTGEGAQAYGHGVYFAENPSVASGYKSRLSASSYIKDSAPVDSGLIWHKAADAALETGKLHPDNAGQISSQIMDWVDSGKKPETFLRFNKVSPQLQPAYEAAVKEYVGAMKNKGSLYKADLPDEMIDRMLDWDKPLSEQPESVRKALTSWVKTSGSQNAKIDLLDKTGNLEPDASGRLIYEIMSEKGNLGSQEAASAWLKKAGIPGIKYLDAGSRGAGGSGTRNFVVFPGEEKKVRILERK